MDIDTLYQGLFKKYTNTSVSAKRGAYETSARKVAEMIERDKHLLRGLTDEATDNDEYIPYPDYDDKNFNKKIYNKKEFNQVYKDIQAIHATDDKDDFDTLSKKKCSQTEFTLSSNQRFIKNFLSPLTPYNGLLLYHSVGVGKTCTAISIAEQYHRLYQKPILVILSSTLIDNFKKQIFDITKYDITTEQSNLCTGTTYPDLIYDKALLKPEALEKTINKIINDRYKFMGYKKLVSIFNQTMEKIKKQEKDVSKHEKQFYDKIKEYFSDRLIIIDEAHNLRNSSEKGTKQTAQTFWNLLKYTDNVKLVLLTATPMFNSVTEIVWLLNLLLTNDKRPNIKVNDIFDKFGQLSTHGRNQLMEISRGYVSYMRGENPFSFPFRLYPSINNDKSLITKYPSIDINNKKIRSEEKIKYLEIIGSTMSSYQKVVYNLYKRKVLGELEEVEDALEDEFAVDEEVDEDGASTNLKKIVQISNVVYPVSDVKDPTEVTKTYGKDGFSNVIVNTGKKGVRYRYTNDCLQHFGEIFAYQNLNKYAPKIKRVIDYVQKSEGIVFIYSNFYPSGIKPLAIALEHIGFVKYNSSNITGDNIRVDDKFNGKKPTYVILSRNGDLSPNNDKEIEIAKSKDNANGDIIKVIIASSIATEGIDFKRIREVHILEPWYNLNRCEQIIGRAVRTCSHIDMPKEKRNVTIYFHACEYDDTEESIDIRTYRIAEQKQKRITEVEKLLKETSIDCNLNKQQLLYGIKDINITIPLRTSQGTVINKYDVGDRDYSYVCNFAKCQLKCEPNISRKDVDETTYDIRFIMDDITLYSRYVSKLYSQNNKKAFTYKKILTDLKSNYKNIDEEILQYTLQEMLDDKYKVYDNNNVRGYLIYRSNKYIFQALANNDKRMTIEQREQPLEVRNRTFLDLGTLKQTLLNKGDKKSAKGVETKASKSKPKLDILEYIRTEYIAIHNMYNEVKLQKYDKFVIDSIIDRLNAADYKALVEKLAGIYNAQSKEFDDDVVQSCLRSLVEANVIIEENNRIQYFYNYFDGDIYCLRSDNEFKKCSPLDLNKIAKKANELKQKMSNDLEDTIKGHIEVNSKDDSCDFKVRDNPKSSGYVCWKTSSLSLNDLKERIKAYDDKIGLQNLIKKDMCFLYEIILRSQGKKVFKRSVTKKLI